MKTIFFPPRVFLECSSLVKFIVPVFKHYAFERRGVVLHGVRQIFFFFFYYLNDRVTGVRDFSVRTARCSGPKVVR